MSQQQWVSLQSGDAFFHAAESLAQLQQTSVDDVLQQFAEVAQSLVSRVDGYGAPGLTSGEVEVVLRSGGVGAEQLLQAEVDLKQGAWTERLLRSALRDQVRSLTTDRAAAALGLGSSAVRHRLRKHTLWSFVVGGEHRLPLWQFVESPHDPERLQVLPNLPRLLADIPDNATASEVNAVMTTPQVALEIDDTPVTVGDWILAGGDPEAAAEVLRTMTTIW